LRFAVGKNLVFLQRSCNFIQKDKREKPEEATSGFKEELPQTTGSSTTTFFF
jgi:hypothetical protein